MEVIDFTITAEPDVIREMLDYVCVHTLKWALTDKLREFNIKGRSKYMSALGWSYSSLLTDEQRKSVRMSYYDQFLKAQRIEEWLMWWSSSKMTAIESVLERYNVRNVCMSLRLNPHEQEAVQQTQETWA